MSAKDKVNDAINNFKQKWLALDANKRRLIIGIFVMAVIVVFATILGDKQKKEAAEKRNIPTDQNLQRSSLVSPKSGEVGLDELKGLNQSEIDSQRRIQDALFQNQQEMASDYRSGKEAMGGQVSDLAQHVASIADEVKALKLGREESAHGVKLPPLQGLDSNIGSLSTNQAQEHVENPMVNNEQPIPVNPIATPDEMIAPREAQPQVDPFQVIRSGKASKEFQSNGFRSGGDAKTQNMSVQANIILSKGLPTGSILTGVLINGMDAPTSGRGGNSAVPALVRVKANAILPNRYSQMTKECFIMVSGVGNLATERAEMRGEKISCIFKDGSEIDMPISAYVVGEDGKSGMRGRVVTKQGAVIARSIFAGTLAGLGKQLAPSSVPSLNISGGSNTNYEVPDIGKASQIAVASGVGNALDRVANFYMDMAEQMVSVIEIDGGRNVTIILTNPMSGVKN